MSNFLEDLKSHTNLLNYFKKNKEKKFIEWLTDFRKQKELNKNTLSKQKEIIRKMNKNQ